MDQPRGYNAKQNKPVRERQIPYDFTLVWNLRNKAEDCRGREEKVKQDETREGETASPLSREPEAGLSPRTLGS